MPGNLLQKSGEILKFYQSGNVGMSKLDEIYPIMDRATDSDGLRLVELVYSWMKQAFREVRGIFSGDSHCGRKKKRFGKRKKVSFGFILEDLGVSCLQGTI